MSFQSVFERATLNTYINGYPYWIIEETIEKVKNQNEMARPTQVRTNTEENELLLKLVYKGKAGRSRLKSLQKALKSATFAKVTLQR